MGARARYLLRPLEGIDWLSDPMGYWAIDPFSEASESIVLRRAFTVPEYPWRREGQYSTFQQGRARAAEDLILEGFDMSNAFVQRMEKRFSKTTAAAFVWRPLDKR